MATATPHNKTLTDNQRRILSELLRKQDKVFISLMKLTRPTNQAVTASEKLTTNLDIKKKLSSSLERLKQACIKEGVYLPVFDEAEQKAKSYMRTIIPGQPRENLRYNILQVRYIFLHALTADKNVNFDVEPVKEVF